MVELPEMRLFKRVDLVAAAGCFLAMSSMVLAAPVTECEARPRQASLEAKEKIVRDKLNGFRKCSTAIDDRTPCNVFVGQALQVLFKNSDFRSKDGGFLRANDIVVGLEAPGNSGWFKIGAASDQTALGKAQELANAGAPVIAAKFGNVSADRTRGPGHVALIVPGKLEHYEADGFRWGALKAPAAASFFLDQPARIFVGCPLSAVWRSPEGVFLYSKH